MVIDIRCYIPFWFVTSRYHCYNKESLFSIFPMFQTRCNVGWVEFSIHIFRLILGNWISCLSLALLFFQCNFPPKAVWNPPEHLHHGPVQSHHGAQWQDEQYRDEGFPAISFLCSLVILLMEAPGVLAQTNCCEINLGQRKSHCQASKSPSQASKSELASHIVEREMHLKRRKQNIFPE